MITGGLHVEMLVPDSMTSWGHCIDLPMKSLDMTRTETTPWGRCGQGTNVSCWALDDLKRDNLSFDTTALGFVTILKPTQQTTLPNGRYIYVWRVSPYPSTNSIVIRRYDRAVDGGQPSCEAYAQYRAQQNWRGATYNHVRHSQLVGDPTDSASVWVAGELRVSDGKVDRINNASGHYQPSTLAVRAFYSWFRHLVPTASNVQYGDFRQVSAAEATCPPWPPEPKVVDDDQEDKDEL